MIFGRLFLVPFLERLAIGARHVRACRQDGKTGIDSRSLEQMGVTRLDRPGEAGWFLRIGR